MLKTLLDFIYVKGGNPSNKPRGYYSFKNAEDKSEGCFLFTWQIMSYIEMKNKGTRLGNILSSLNEHPARSVLTNRGRELILSLRHLDQITETDYIYEWIVQFWLAGFNILEYLHLILSYGQNLLTQSGVEEAIILAEKELNISGKLQEEWKRLDIIQK